MTNATGERRYVHAVGVRRSGRLHGERLVVHRRNADRGVAGVAANGVTATCTINNNDQPATLTLVKTVTNDNGGTALPTAWTLAAAGPTPASRVPPDRQP